MRRTMKILLVVPDSEAPGGNHVTGRRWAGILRELGHHPTILPAWRSGPWDVVVALHAWKNRAAIRAASAHGIPVVAALTGTDLYGDLRRREEARRSLDLAARIVALQPEALKELAPRWRRKTRIIHQSVPAAGRRRVQPADFDV